MSDSRGIHLLKNKIILLISPQPWENLFVSKHHYAIELARNNVVYFLTPLTDKNTNKHGVEIRPVANHKNLFVIEHNLFFPFQIKFHFRRLFRCLMQIQTNRILKRLKKKVDIVWSFDLGNYFPFDFFSKDVLKIFHPVDEPLNKDAIDSAKNADIIFSVTHEILEKYNHLSIPKHFINHGVSGSFLNKENNNQPFSDQIHVGLSGNLRRKDIDREILLKIIQENDKLVFDIWGQHKPGSSSFQQDDKEAGQFIDRLSTFSNVRFHGILSPDKLSKAYDCISIFLICYDVEKDQSKGTNYHKILEFLSTGKVVVSNNVTTYRNMPNLVQMVNERNNNRQLPELFKMVLNNLQYFNSDHFQQERKSYSNECSYENNIRKIDTILNQSQLCVV